MEKSEVRHGHVDGGDLGSSEGVIVIVIIVVVCVLIGLAVWWVKRDSLKQNILRAAAKTGSTSQYQAV